MQRVLVIGCSGSGKSTLSIALSKATGLPVIHIDHLFWQAGWVQTPNDIYLAKLEAAVASERWIMDGINKATFDLRIPRADTIIWLHRSRALCLWRIFRRVLTRYGKVRPDMAPGCPERFDWVFTKWVWNFHREYTPIICAALDRHRAWSRTVILRSNSEVAAFLRGDLAPRTTASAAPVL